jgi:hypothetical protein
MSAKPKLATPDALLSSIDDEHDATGSDGTEHTIPEDSFAVPEHPKLAQPEPAQITPDQPAKPDGPLSPLKAMSEEEIIALFT